MASKVSTVAAKTSSASSAVARAAAATAQVRSVVAQQQYAQRMRVPRANIARAAAASLRGIGSLETLTGTQAAPRWASGSMAGTKVTENSQARPIFNTGSVLNGLGATRARRFFPSGSLGWLGDDGAPATDPMATAQANATAADNSMFADGNALMNQINPAPAPPPAQTGLPAPTPVPGAAQQLPYNGGNSAPAPSTAGTYISPPDATKNYGAGYADGVDHQAGGTLLPASFLPNLLAAGQTILRAATETPTQVSTVLQDRPPNGIQQGGGSTMLILAAAAVGAYLLLK